MSKPFVFEPFQCIESMHTKQLALKVILLRRITSKDAFESLRPKAYFLMAVNDSQKNNPLSNFFIHQGRCINVTCCHGILIVSTIVWQIVMAYALSMA